MSKPLTPVQNFFKAALTASTTAGAGKIYISIAPSVSMGYLVISPANTSKREIIYYDSTGTDVNGIYVNVPSAAERGMGGTTAQAHEQLESIRMNIVSTNWDDMITEVLTNIPASIAAVVASVATKASLALDNVFSGENTFDGDAIFNQTIQANNGLVTPNTIQIADPVNANDAATKAYVLSIAFGGSLAGGLIQPEVNYRSDGKVQSVHDVDTGKTYVFVYDTKDVLVAISDEANQWSIAYDGDGVMSSITKH